jgi:hypothetical protein
MFLVLSVFGRAVRNYNGIIPWSAGGPLATIHYRSLPYQQLGCRQTLNNIVCISAFGSMTQKS